MAIIRVLKRFKEQRLQISELSSAHEENLDTLGRLIETDLPNRLQNGNIPPKDAEVILITVLPTEMIHHYLRTGKLGSTIKGEIPKYFYPYLPPERSKPYLIVGGVFHKYRKEHEHEEERKFKKRILNFKEILSYYFYYSNIAKQHCLVFEEDKKLYFIHDDEFLTIGTAKDACKDKLKLIFTTGEEIYV